MSIETYEDLTSRFELYGLIKEGLDDIAQNNTTSLTKKDEHYLAELLK